MIGKGEEREGRDWEIKERGRGIKGGKGVVKGKNQNQKTTLTLNLAWRMTSLSGKLKYYNNHIYYY